MQTTEIKAKTSAYEKLGGDPKDFINCAVILVDTFRSPAEMLKFMSDALKWKNTYITQVGVKQENNFVFEYCLILENVICPWMEETDPIPSIAEGLIDLYDFFGHDGARQMYSQMLQDAAHYFHDLYYNPKDLTEFQRKIGFFIHFIDSCQKAENSEESARNKNEVA